MDLEVFREMDKNKVKEELGLDVNIRYIGTVIRIEKNKGYDTLIEAIYMLKELDYMKNTKLIIIGTGDLQKDLDKLIKKYHVEDLVIQKNFVYQDFLVKYYNAFDIFIFPTKRESESLGLVGLEAMACKTLVIGCNLYGPSEYLKDKVNSLTYDKIDSGKYLARKIMEAMDMPLKTKKEIINEAYLTAKRFSSDEQSNKLKEIFGD